MLNDRSYYKLELKLTDISTGETTTLDVPMLQEAKVELLPIETHRDIIEGGWPPVHISMHDVPTKYSVSITGEAIPPMNGYEGIFTVRKAND